MVFYRCFVNKSLAQAVLNTELGHGWRDQFMEFDSVPIAAASIGQVHRATLLDGSLVAVKVQYPGVAESIDSDLDNLKSLLLLGNLLPRGLFLDSSVAAARKELAWETDYVREAESTLRFGHLLADDACFSVPNVITELSGRRVLTTTWAQGVPLGQLEREPQAVRDWVATRMLDLCLRELFVFKFMQTDPNWTNFFYDGSRKKVRLGLAFGVPGIVLTDFAFSPRSCYWTLALQEASRTAFWTTTWKSCAVLPIKIMTALCGILLTLASSRGPNPR